MRRHQGVQLGVDVLPQLRRKCLPIITGNFRWEAVIPYPSIYKRLTGVCGGGVWHAGAGGRAVAVAVGLSSDLAPYSFLLFLLIRPLSYRTE